MYSQGGGTLGSPIPSSIEETKAEKEEMKNISQ